MAEEAGVQRGAAAAASYQRPGLRSIAPSLVVRDAAGLIDFLKAAFGGVEQLRVPAEDGSIVYAVVAIGNGAVEVGEARETYPGAAAAVHLYVNDADIVYAKALEAGAIAVTLVEDQPWGDRQGTVKDRFGNRWYVSKAGSWADEMESVSSVQPFLHVLEADGLIAFAEAAFGAESSGLARSPEGLVLHATLHIGDATFEVDDSAAGNEPTACYLHIYVPDTDASFEAALRAGAEPVDAPADKPYGDRSAAVMDRWGNCWFVSTYLSL
ncbi:MAG TPA: VOC family protein [Acidisarcina sp.]